MFGWLQIIGCHHRFPYISKLTTLTRTTYQYFAPTPDHSLTSLTTIRLPLVCRPLLCGRRAVVPPCPLRWPTKLLPIAPTPCAGLFDVSMEAQGTPTSLRRSRRRVLHPLGTRVLTRNWGAKRCRKMALTHATPPTIVRASRSPNPRQDYSLPVIP